MSAQPSQDAPPLGGLRKTSYILVSLVATGIILHYTQDYVIPFILALIIWFIIHELRENLQMIPYIRDNWPLWVQSTIAFVVINIVLVVIGQLLISSVAVLTESIELYETNFNRSMLELNEILGMDILSQIIEYVDNMDVSAVLSSTIDYASLLLGNSFLILIYIIFLLVEESVFETKMHKIYTAVSKQKKNKKLFQKMDKNISRYLSLKSLVSLLTGILSYFALLAFGIDAPIFWALLIFVLNYIPTVGSLIATLFPAFFAILQFGELAPFIYVLISVGTIQVIVGNIVEPKIMGNSLNLSSLVVILSLTIWGAIWGVMGMILSVPITVMMIIVCEEIPSLRFVAVALSERGDIRPPDEEE
ncbi:AI-2E family transporter [Marinoscillum sp. MHG1-6]|uniref:AI-2E family transporter n=1 Tax=Marinoscillum sp. MHG1-6 TaxID=2959627 RepID=UPI00215744B1|nr:AI-2E family transporter [Marinoscillum sp. MHG1-6]